MQNLASSFSDLTGAQGATGEAGGPDLTPANPQNGSGGANVPVPGTRTSQNMHVSAAQTFFGTNQPFDGSFSAPFGAAPAPAGA